VKYIQWNGTNVDEIYDFVGGKDLFENEIVKYNPIRFENKDGYFDLDVGGFLAHDGIAFVKLSPTDVITIKRRATRDKEAKLKSDTSVRKKDEKVPTIQELGKALLTKHEIHYNLEKQRVTIIDNDYKHTNVHVQEGDTFSLENGIAIAIVKHFFGYGVVKELAKKAKRTDKESANNRKNAQLKIDDVADFNEWCREIIKTLNEDLDKETVDRKASFNENLKNIKFTDVGGVKEKRPPKFKLWDNVEIMGFGEPRKGVIVGIEPQNLDMYTYLVYDGEGKPISTYSRAIDGEYAKINEFVRVRRFLEGSLKLTNDPEAKFFRIVLE
jgi:hypothetical protein